LSKLLVAKVDGKLAGLGVSFCDGFVDLLLGLLKVSNLVKSELRRGAYLCLDFCSLHAEVRGNGPGLLKAFGGLFELTLAASQYG